MVYIYSSRFNSSVISSSGVITYKQNQKPIDNWIDELNLNTSDESLTSGGISEMTMMWLTQESLPKIEIEPFSGTLIGYIEFIVNFKEIYLLNDPRIMYLL